jgi:hypothetical protein
MVAAEPSACAGICAWYTAPAVRLVGNAEQYLRKCFPTQRMAIKK